MVSGHLPADQPGVRSGGALLVGASLAIAIVAGLAAFRAPFPAFALSLGADGGRWLAAAAVGACLAVASLVRPASHPLREAMLFAGSVGAAAGVAFGLKTFGPAPALAFGAAGGALGAGVVRLLDRQARVSNLALLFVLLFFFALGTPAYMTGATERESIGGLSSWLMGDVSRASGWGAGLAFVAALAACAFAAFRGAASSAGLAALLFGLAVGIGGPVAFVGALGAGAARTLRTGSATARVATGAAVGASAVVAVDAVGRLAIGGYAPPLNLTLGFVAVPAFAWWNRRRLRRENGRSAHPAFEVFEAAVIAAVVAGLAGFSVALIGYVRSAT